MKLTFWRPTPKSEQKLYASQNTRMLAAQIGELIRQRAGEIAALNDEGAFDAMRNIEWYLDALVGEIRAAELARLAERTGDALGLAQSLGLIPQNADDADAEQYDFAYVLIKGRDQPERMTQLVGRVAQAVNQGAPLSWVLIHEGVISP